jgi:hypothetical protein
MRKVCMQALLVLACVSGTGRAEGLAEFTSEAGGFKVLMPGKPSVTEMPTPAGTMHMVQVRTKAGEYLASWIDLPFDAADKAEKAEGCLDRVRDGMVDRVKGKLVRDKKFTLEDKHPGRDVEAETTQPAKGRMRARLFLVGSRLYQVIVAGSKEWTESKEADRVLDSFRLTK